MFTDLEALGTWAIIIGGTLVVIVVSILVFRAIVLWYFRINDIIKLLEKLVGVSATELTRGADRSPNRSPMRKAIRDETAARMGRSDLTWDCPKCHEKNPNSTFECKKCGYSLK